ncbi:MAG: DUF4265 domain-containing protein [Chloroflexota bacterium]
MTDRSFAHAEPAWADQADAVFERPIWSGNGTTGMTESLACASQPDGSLVLCCVPFYTYNLALGDRFRPATYPLSQDEVDVVERRGAVTFRVWLRPEATAEDRARIVPGILDGVDAAEWATPDLLAVSVLDTNAPSLFDRLLDARARGFVLFEVASPRPGERVAVHMQPVWFDRCTGVAFAEVSPEGSGRWALERLEVGPAEDGSEHLKLCSIPFFATGLALGDVVEVGPDTETLSLQHILRVVRPSGQQTFRYFMLDSAPDGLVTTIARAAHGMGCVVEPFSLRFVGVSAPDTETGERLSAYLTEVENAQHIVWEILDRAYDPYARGRARAAGLTGDDDTAGRDQT